MIEQISNFTNVVIEYFHHSLQLIHTHPVYADWILSKFMAHRQEK